MKTKSKVRNVSEQMTPKLESLLADVEQEMVYGKVSREFESTDAFLAELKK